LESDPSIVADFSMGRDAYQYYDQFLEHFEHEVVIDCIDNYMFLADHSCDAFYPAVPLSYDHSYEGETAIVGDQELVSKEQGGHLFASREAFTEEHPGPLKQPELCHVIHDPVAIYMESYVSDVLKFSNGIISPILTGEYGFMKDFQDQTIDPFPLFIKEKHWVGAKCYHIGLSRVVWVCCEYLGLYPCPVSLSFAGRVFKFSLRLVKSFLFAPFCLKDLVSLDVLPEKVSARSLYVFL
jgi:hypothetical protein